MLALGGFVGWGLEFAELRFHVRSGFIFLSCRRASAFGRLEVRMGLVHKTRGVVPVVVVASYCYYGSCGCSRVQKSALANLLDFENQS